MQLARITKKLQGKTILVTGGTGSFGRQIAKSLLETPVREIRVLSRDEDLQHQMASSFEDSRLRFMIGDVRDMERVREATHRVDYVFHAAALKQVPDCETHPVEAVKTNILGAHNVKTAAQMENVEALVFISTDKAVKPVNAMGMSKALQEKIFLAPDSSERTRICGVRYGNVLGSRGSVVPLYASLKKEGQPLVVTHRDMTRFLLTLGDAIELVFTALLDGKPNEMFVMKRPACKILDLAEVIAEDQVPVKIGKVRPGEKIHETIVQEEEMRRSVEDENFFRICPYGTKGVPKLRSEYSEYTSENTRRMDKREIAALLRSEGWL
jgi:UDP-N-acetylglucosamine 4,6-dehydratase/5-epimerase